MFQCRNITEGSGAPKRRDAEFHAFVSHLVSVRTTLTGSILKFIYIDELCNIKPHLLLVLVTPGDVK